MHVSCDYLNKTATYVRFGRKRFTFTVDPVADAPHENAREEGPRPRTGTADLQTSLADAREFHNGQRLYHICRPSEPSDLTHYEDIAVLC